MIITEQITINNKQFIKTYSDAGFMIERDGVQYGEAIDLSELGRTYTETDIPIDIDPTPEPETDIPVEADSNPEPDLTVSDTLEMLSEMGVDTDD